MDLACGAIRSGIRTVPVVICSRIRMSMWLIVSAPRRGNHKLVLFRKVLFVFLLLLLFSFEHTCVYYRINPFFFYLACAPSNRQPRQSPFSRMGAGPFHSPMGAMGGMGHMSPAMGGPSMGGQSRGNAGSMFTTTVGLGCVRHEIVCPNWCLAVDANGCKSCPCGPGMICFQCYVHFSSSLWEIFINTMYTYIE